MCWRMQILANVGTLNTATDGDMDIAFALLLAAKVPTIPPDHHH